MSLAPSTAPPEKAPDHVDCGDSPGEAGARPMNPMDSLMAAVNLSLQAMGLSGFETQTLVRLGGRADVGRLRSGIARLGRRYPAVTARLVEASRGKPRWQGRPGAEAALVEITLGSASEDAVLEEASRLLSAPHDLAADDAVRFYLLHLPDGSDVFLMQYNHALMDNNAAVPVLREIERLADVAGDDGECVDECRDAMAEHLERFPLRRRLRAAWRVADLRLRVLRFRRLRLGTHGAGPSEPVPFRVLSQTLGADESAALLARVVEVCRWPGMSMVVLGSVFRGLDRFAAAGDGRRDCVAGIGVDLGLRGPAGPLFQNLVSLFPVAARREELADRDSLMRDLNRQLRERLARDADLGVLELARIFRRFPRFFRRSTERLLRDSYSLWYGYFGSADAAGARFCGAEITGVRFVGPCWPPAGVTLLVNQFRGRTHFQLTYLPNTVPDAVADEFLEAVIGDLRAFACGAS